MKTLVLGVVLASMLMAGCKSKNSSGSATVANAGEAPMMKFESESHDFGKIANGQKVTYDFKFKNEGKSPLIITDAVATCGCTKPEWPKIPIKPGDAAAIHITFDSAGKMGLQDKLITITANTVPAQSMVHLIGEVIASKN